MVRSCAAVLSLAVLVFMGGSVPVLAQQQDSARVKALRDVHGPDETGKDGPLSAAGLDLLLLYHRYQAAADPDDFAPTQSGLSVSDGRVTVDAIAQEDAQQLRSDLEALGMTNTAAAGRIVSGQLPIDQIPEAARLETLRGLTIPQAQTRTQPLPAPPDAPAAPEKAAPADSADDSSDGAGGGALSFLFVSGIVLLLVEGF
jgi:hypothetical protein